MTESTIQREAAQKGFTRAVVADSDEYTLEGWIRPDADLEGRFAMMLDDGEFIRVNGWLFTVEEA